MQQQFTEKQAAEKLAFFETCYGSDSDEVKFAKDHLGKNIIKDETVYVELYYRSTETASQRSGSHGKKLAARERGFWFLSFGAWK